MKPIKQGAITDGLAQNDPAGHADDALEFAGQYDPNVQGEAELDPTEQKKPSGHVRHAD